VYNIYIYTHMHIRILVYMHIYAYTRTHAALSRAAPLQSELPCTPLRYSCTTSDVSFCTDPHYCALLRLAQYQSTPICAHLHSSCTRIALKHLRLSLVMLFSLVWPSINFINLKDLGPPLSPLPPEGGSIPNKIKLYKRSKLTNLDKLNIKFIKSYYGHS